MRLIDADALVKIKFHGYPEIEIVPSGVNAEAYKRGWNDAIDAIIECEPSIDAVKHGRWLQKPNIFGVAYCSECDYELHTDDTNFCPNCGADMREREDNYNYERAVEQLEHDMLYEPTFNPNDGSM